MTGKVIVISLVLNGCAVISVDTYPNGLSHLGIYTLGTNQTLQDFNSSTSSTGDKKISLGKYTENESTGIMQLNKSLEAIVTNVIKVLSFGIL